MSNELHDCAQITSVWLVGEITFVMRKKTERKSSSLDTGKLRLIVGWIDWWPCQKQKTQMVASCNRWENSPWSQEWFVMAEESRKLIYNSFSSPPIFSSFAAHIFPAQLTSRSLLYNFSIFLMGRQDKREKGVGASLQVEEWSDLIFKMLSANENHL